MLETTDRSNIGSNMDDKKFIRYNYFKIITDRIIELLKKEIIPSRSRYRLI